MYPREGGGKRHPNIGEIQIMFNPYALPEKRGRFLSFKKKTKGFG